MKKVLLLLSFFVTVGAMSETCRRAEFTSKPEVLVYVAKCSADEYVKSFGTCYDAETGALYRTEPVSSRAVSCKSYALPYALRGEWYCDEEKTDDYSCLGAMSVRLLCCK